jgi:hypothetical protein
MRTDASSQPSYPIIERVLIRPPAGRRVPRQRYIEISEGMEAAKTAALGQIPSRFAVNGNFVLEVALELPQG